MLHRGPFHGEGVPPSLKVVVAEDGAAYDGQVGVGAYKVVGKQLDKVQQLAESRPVDFHRGVGTVERDAVLVVIYIGRIL